MPLNRRPSWVDHRTPRPKSICWGSPPRSFWRKPSPLPRSMTSDALSRPISTCIWGSPSLSPMPSAAWACAISRRLLFGDPIRATGAFGLYVRPTVADTASMSLMPAATTSLLPDGRSSARTAPSSSIWPATSRLTPSNSSNEPATAPWNLGKMARPSGFVVGVPRAVPGGSGTTTRSSWAWASAPPASETPDQTGSTSARCACLATASASQYRSRPAAMSVLTARPKARPATSSTRSRVPARKSAVPQP